MLRKPSLLLSLLILLATFSAEAGAPLSVRIRRDNKQRATVTVNFTPLPTDRHMHVVVESENVFKSAYQQLEGADSRSQYLFEWRLPNDGIYTVLVVVQDNAGKERARAEAKFITMPPMGQP